VTRPLAPDAPRRGPGSRIPAPLGALLAATALLAVTWALVTPAFMAPDEFAHIAYVQSLGEDFRLPGDVERQPLSTELNEASAAMNATQTAAVIDVKLEWRQAAYLRWRARTEQLGAAARADGGGPNPASSNPPLYYLFETVAYRAAYGGDFFDRLLAARMASLLWLLVTVTACWLLAGEIFGRNRLLQLATASVAGLAPMMSFISATVNPDAALYAVWSLALWLGVRILRRKLTPGRAAAFCAAVGLTVCIKAIGIALIPPALLVLALGLSARRPLPRSRALLLAGSGLAALAATAGAWVIVARLLGRPAASQVAGAATGGTDFRELASYLWQFYLPRAPFQSDYATGGIYETFVKGSWGKFGWLEVQFSSPVYWLLTAITVVTVVAAGIVVWRKRGTIHRGIAVFLAAVCVALLAALHWTDYHQLEAGSQGFMQARYLFPLVGIAGLVVAQALQLLPAQRHAVGAAAVVGGLFVLQVLALGVSIVRFYA
jgi:hypothetical protein